MLRKRSATPGEMKTGRPITPGGTAGGTAAGTTGGKRTRSLARRIPPQDAWSVLLRCDASDPFRWERSLALAAGIVRQGGKCRLVASGLPEELATRSPNGLAISQPPETPDAANASKADAAPSGASHESEKYPRTISCGQSTVLVVPPPSGNGSDDATFVAKLARRCHAIVLDHGGLGDRWRTSLRRIRPLAVFDDSGKISPGSADLIVNPFADADSRWYEDVGRALLGPRFSILSESYAPLRDLRELSVFRDPLPGRKLSLVLGFHAPSPGIPQAIREATASLPEWKGVLYFGGCNSASRLETLSPQWEELLSDCPIDLARPDDSLAALLSRSDLGLFEAGPLLASAACLGVPSYAFATTAANAASCHAWQESGAIAGWSQIDEGSSPGLRVAIPSWGGDGEIRRRIALAAMQLVDGRGADRVAVALGRLAEPHRESLRRSA